MTTATSIAQLAADYAETKQAADNLYRALKEIEYELITALRTEYAVEWEAWERGVRKFQAEGVSVDLKRQYDVDKLNAELGEEMPELFELVTPEPYLKADGRKLAQLWKDAAMARRLERCLVPQVPKVKVGE